jgi:hypothetical protein
MSKLPLLLTTALCLGILGIALTAQAQTAPKKQKNKPTLLLPTGPARFFLRVDNQHQLWEGKLPFRNVGGNLPDLFERFLKHDDAAAIQSLNDAKTVGIRFVRCFGSTWGSEGFGPFETDRARWLDAFDRMLAAADSAGIGIVPSLLFNINMLPDYVRRTTGKDERVVNLLTPGSASNSLALTYVSAIVTRFKDDPRVLFWEIGNEYNLEADLSAQWKRRPANQIPSSDQIRAFLIQIATQIKQLDKKHLVTSGNSDMRPYAWHIRQAMLAHRNAADPNDYPMDWNKDNFQQYVEMLRFFNPSPLDIISVHLYPTTGDTPNWLYKNDTLAATLPWARTASDLVGKPLFVGEFGQETIADGKEAPMPWTLDFLACIETDAAPLAAIWAWEFDQGDPPMPSAATLSPQRTPNMARALAQANQRILQDILGNKQP